MCSRRGSHSQRPPCLQIADGTNKFYLVRTRAHAATGMVATLTTLLPPQIQVVKAGKSFYFFKKWGRVGGGGRSAWGRRKNFRLYR